MGEPKRVRITIEARGDGGIRIRSDDVPGLILSHSNAEAVGADIVPALRVLVPELFEGEGDERSVGHGQQAS